MNHPDDGRFEVIAQEVEKAIDAGATCFQKFTCLACRARQTMALPNVLYTKGKCDECGFVTDLKAEGCGFMLIVSSDPTEHDAFVSILQESISSAQPRNRN